MLNLNNGILVQTKDMTVSSIPIYMSESSTEDSDTSLKDEDDKSEWTPSERLNLCGPRSFESSRFHLILEDKVKKLLRNHLNIL